MRYFLAALLVFAAVATPAGAQIVRGRVTDPESNLRLRAAEVVLVSERGRDVARAMSDTAGAFVLAAPRPGFYRLRATLIGYTSVTTEPIEVRAHEALQVGLRMSATAIAVQPLIVTAHQRGPLTDFERRRLRRATGYFITQDEIDSRVTLYTSSLLVTIPGITMLDGHFGSRYIAMQSPRGRCLAQIYLDGMPLPPGTSIDDIMIPSWVGAIEVYTRPVSVPLEFQTFSNCGAVAFWTRENTGSGFWNWKKFAGAGVLVAFAGWVALR